MTHISKQKLSDEKSLQLFRQFHKTIAHLNRHDTPLFLDELLGKEEKIMLAKRLAAIIMCIENNSVYKISLALKISPSTAERIKLNHQVGKYASIQKSIMRNKNEYGRLLTTLETILQARLPPRGRGRWKRFFMER